MTIQRKLSVAICVLAGLGFASAALAERKIDFNRDIRPILSDKCFACHGPDEGNLQAGLRLDEVKIATGALESGAIAVVPGSPEASELIRRITDTDETQRMPPAEFGKSLSAEEIAALSQWIEQGARYAAHWSYVKPVRTAPPAAPEDWTNWPRNAIDHFALQAMIAHNLHPAPEADRYALARRVFLDLTGLPPTVEEMDAFVKNDDPQAYEKLVDELLRRPTFGEHWARMWLDLARYADSAGYADDPPRTIWAYRDWVIKALNDNMPFDQFTIDQIAGDLLPNPSEEQLVATAFHRNTMTNNEGGTQDEEFRNAAVVDRVNTTMAVWMGTTIACAQCHSHKFDPITQQEYFQFFAILNNTQDADLRDEAPLLPLYTDEQRCQREELQSRIAQLRGVLKTPTEALAQEQVVWEQLLREVPTWDAVRPEAIQRDSKQPATILEDRTILVQQSMNQDIYTVDVLNRGPETRALAAIRLETLPHPSLPGGGAGFGGGNFVITGVRAQFVPPAAQLPQGRFVRVTNHGSGQILSLAEVKVVSGGKNVALAGSATQHSTANGGLARLAIDGETNGNFEKRSVTHTETVDEPWWEVDLGQEFPIEKISIWNRTDNDLHTRLKDFTVEVFDAKRESRWQKKLTESPKPSVEFSPDSIHEIELQTAAADYQQPEFAAENVIHGDKRSRQGWAVGGAIKSPHSLVVAPGQAVAWENGFTLRLSIEQKSEHKNHLLGHFRVSTSSSRSAGERSLLPATLLATLDKAGSERSAQDAAELANYFRENAAPSLQNQRQELAKAEAALRDMQPAIALPILRELTDKRRETRLQYRGNYLDKGPVVEPGLPAAFQAAPAGRPLDRLSLARWLVSQDNPLTARVIANRYWEALFGRGTVLTSEEFGSQGEPPTHPELLDWLATELMDNGWDTRSLIRRIVTSAVYRQSTKVVGNAAETDPDNRWLARGPRVRLSAEMVRDQALAVSGLLSHKMYGPPVRPPQPSLGLTAAFGSSTDWETSTGEDRYRRAIYTTWRRSNPYPSMATFDAPNREVCTVRRSPTNTPLQSLVTLNDPAFVEAAQALARRAIQHSAKLEDQIAFALRCCVLRPPIAPELQALVDLYKDSQARLADQPEAAIKLATVPLGDLPAGVEAANAAAMTVVCNVLLNLDEMFLKR